MSTARPKRDVREVEGPYHEFWLFREGERAYTNYERLFGREGAAARLPDEVVTYHTDMWNWVPTVNGAWPDGPHGHGLTTEGVTVINAKGGAFQRICSALAALYEAAPKCVVLTGEFGYEAPADVNLRQVSVVEAMERYGAFDTFSVDRDELVQALGTLADLGGQAASGKYFVMHLGV